MKLADGAKETAPLKKIEIALSIAQTMPSSSQFAAVRQLSVKDTGIFLGLLLLLVWAPLPLGSNRTWAVGLIILWALILLLGTAFVWRHEADAAFARLAKFRWPLILLGAFVALTWLQTIPLPDSMLTHLSPETFAVQKGVATSRLSLDIYQSRIFASLSFAYFACFLVAVLVVRNGQRLDVLAQTLVWNGLLQAVFGVLLFSGGATYRLFFFDVIHDRVIGSYGNTNHFAGYMEMCLSVGIGLMLARLEPYRRQQQGGWRPKLVAALAFIISPKMRLRIMLVIMVIALVLTRSRMGNSAFFASTLVVGLVAIVLARKTAPTTVALIASLVIIDVLVIGSWIGLERVVQRVQETSVLTADGEQSVELRVEAAEYATSLVRDFPVFGTGGGSFYNTYMRYRTPREGYFDHAHNDYVEIASDFGLLGLGLLGAFVVLTAWKSLWVLARRRSSLPRGIAFGALMSIVSLALHSTVDFNLQIPANALTLVVIISMAWVAAELESKTAGPKEEKHRHSSESKTASVSV